MISIQKHINSLANKFQSLSDLIFLTDSFDYCKKFAIHTACNNLYWFVDYILSFNCHHKEFGIANIICVFYHTTKACCFIISLTQCT
jgi:hypothetical protein